MNNNELIQENFNSSLEVNNPFSSAVNPLEPPEIVNDTGNFSSPSLDIANEPTATEIESLIEIASPINSDSLTTSEDLLTGTNGKNTALLKVADDLVDPNFNLLDPPTEKVTQKDSIAVDLNNFESDNNAKLSDFLETNSLEIIKNLEKSDRATEISQKIDDLLDEDSGEQSDYDALVKRFEASKDSLVEIPEDDLNSTSENGASATANLLEKEETESNSQEIEIKEVNNNNSASKSSEDSGEENDSEEDDEDKKDGKGDRDIEDKKDKDRDGDKDNEKEGKSDRDGDGDGDKDNEKDGDGDGGEIEIEGLKKAIAFLEKNDIFNLPKNISEVSIEVETGKKGLNKLLQNQQFNALLEQLGLPTGKALKNKLKGDEVEIEKEIKLPDGSTLSIELEAEEGQIKFSLEIERDDEEILISRLPITGPLIGLTRELNRRFFIIFGRELVPNRNDACTPYSSKQEADINELFLRENSIPLQRQFFGNEVAQLYTDYLNRKPGDSLERKVFDNPNSEIVQGFIRSNINNPTQVKIILNVFDRLKNNSSSLPNIPPNTWVDIPLEQLLPTSLGVDEKGNRIIGGLDNYDIDYALAAEIPGQLAGGQKGGSDAGQDIREVSGSISFFREVNDSGITTKATVRPNLRIRVLDALDFCPGNLGVGPQLAFTVPLSRLEASGSAYDVPFEVIYDVPPLEVNLAPDLIEILDNSMQNNSRQV